MLPMEPSRYLRGHQCVALTFSSRYRFNNMSKAVLVNSWDQPSFLYQLQALCSPRSEHPQESTFPNLCCYCTTKVWLFQYHFNPKCLFLIPQSSHQIHRPRPPWTPATPSRAAQAPPAPCRWTRISRRSRTTPWTPQGATSSSPRWKRGEMWQAQRWVDGTLW